MEIKRKTEIFVEKTRRFVIRQPETDETILCPACGERMLTAEAAAVLFHIKCRQVYQLVEAGATHFAETETGAMFVCPSSLDRAIGAADNDPLVVTRAEIEPPRIEPDQPIDTSQFQNG